MHANWVPENSLSLCSGVVQELARVAGILVGRRNVSLHNHLMQGRSQGATLWRACINRAGRKMPQRIGVKRCLFIWVGVRCIFTHSVCVAMTEGEAKVILCL